MFESFRSFKAKYKIKPKKLINLLDDLSEEMRISAKRRQSPSFLCPSYCLYYNQENTGRFHQGQTYYSKGSITRIEDLFGSTIRISASRVEGESKGILAEMDIGKIVVSKTGKSINLIVKKIKNLAVNPEPVYRIAEKYKK